MRVPSQAAFDATSLLYHIRFDLSRGFWKVFEKLFSRSFRNLVLAVRRKCPTIISHLFSFVKRFFESFFNFFRDPFGCLSEAWPSQKRSAIISHLFPFVKRFSKSFSTFFAIFSRVRSLSRGQLAHYSTFMLPCQGGFWNFFLFGSFGGLAQCGWSRLVQHRQPVTIFYPDSPFSRRKKPPSWSGVNPSQKTRKRKANRRIALNIS